MPHWNWAAFITFFIFVTFLSLVKALKGLLKRPNFMKCFRIRWRGKEIPICPSHIPIPSEIIAVVVAVVTSHFSPVHEKYNLEVIDLVSIG